MQLAEPLSGDDLPGEWRAAGAIYDHVATDIADFIGASSRALDLRAVRSDTQVESFAEMMMQGRIPRPVRDQARPGLQRIMRAAADRPGANLLLAYDGDALVGQVALMDASGHALDRTEAVSWIVEAERSSSGVNIGRHTDHGLPAEIPVDAHPGLDPQVRAGERPLWRRSLVESPRPESSTP